MSAGKHDDIAADDPEPNEVWEAANSGTPNIPMDGLVQERRLREAGHDMRDLVVELRPEPRLL